MTGLSYFVILLSDILISRESNSAEGKEVMGEKDLIEKHLVRKNKVFADIMNNITFQGRQLPDSSTLQNLPTESDTKRVNGRWRQGCRDVRKR